MVKGIFWILFFITIIYAYSSRIDSEEIRTSILPPFNVGMDEMTSVIFLSGGT